MSQGWSEPNLGLGRLSVEEIARRADYLLNDPLLTAVLEEMDSEAVLVWRRSGTPAQREDAWMRVSVIADMRNRLNSAIEDFKLRVLRDRKLKIKQD